MGNSEHRSRIVNSVFENGVLAPKQLRQLNQKPYHSMDPGLAVKNRDVVFSCLVFKDGDCGLDWKMDGPDLMLNLNGQEMVGTTNLNAPDSSTFQDYLIDFVLYKGFNSVLPVLAERSGFFPKIIENLKPGEISNRCLSSMLVIASLSGLVIREGYDYVLEIENCIPAENIKTIVAPESLCLDAFDSTDIPVERVGVKNARLLEQQVIFIKIEADVPDYESAVRKHLASSEEPFLIHGVRLP